MKLEMKMKAQDKLYQKEIESLKREMSNLIKINKKLGNKLIKEQKNKKNELNNDIISFVEKYDNKVEDLKKTLKESKKSVENNFIQNKEILKKEINSSKEKYSKIIQ